MLGFGGFAPHHSLLIGPWSQQIAECAKAPLPRCNFWVEGVISDESSESSIQDALQEEGPTRGFATSIQKNYSTSTGRYVKVADEPHNCTHRSIRPKGNLIFYLSIGKGKTARIPR
jgi:hypothetical protein